MASSRGREGVHTVDKPGVFQRVPHDLVLGLERIVAHGVHGPDEGYPAAPGGNAIDLFGGILGILHGNERGEEQPSPGSSCVYS